MIIHEYTLIIYLIFNFVPIEKENDSPGVFLPVCRKRQLGMTFFCLHLTEKRRLEEKKLKKITLWLNTYPI